MPNDGLDRRGYDERTAVAVQCEASAQEVDRIRVAETRTTRTGFCVGNQASNYFAETVTVSIATA
jgi:hypothetical protein